MSASAGSIPVTRDIAPGGTRLGSEAGARVRRAAIVLLALLAPVLTIVKVGGNDANVCLADLVMPPASLWLAWRFLSRGARFPLAGVCCASLAVVAVSLLANAHLTLGARGTAGLVVETSKILLLWLYFYMTVNLVRSRRDLHLLVGTWLAGSALVAMTGIWGSLSFHLWQVRTPYSLDTRAHGTLGDANFFSMHMGASLLLTLFYCRLAERRPWWAAPLAALHLAAILLAASRSGLLALAAGLLVLPAFRTGLRTKLALAASALALAGLLVLAPGTMDWIRSNPFTARLATTTLDPAQTDRKALWANASRAFLSSPLLGVGYGNAAYFDLSGGVRMSEAHNTYLGLLAETGIVGLGVYLAAILYFPAVLARDARRALPPGSSRAVPALVAAFVVILAAGVPVNVENFRGLWILMGIAYSYRLLRHGSGASRAGRTRAGGVVWQAGGTGGAGAG